MHPWPGVLKSDARERTDRQEDPMSAMDSDEVRTEALFVSDVQRSQQPTPELIRQAVSATVDRLGENGCAELVAQEFGEHPDCALGRMQWARTQVRRAFQDA
jgi:choline dehydrogenase-like flavoprotein